MPANLTEIRTSASGTFEDMALRGTTAAAGLEAGMNASLWFRLDPTGRPDMP